MDPWATALCGHSVNSATSYPAGNTAIHRTDAITSTGMVLARNYTLLGGSGSFALISAVRWNGGIGYGSASTNPFPNPSNNSINLLPILAVDNSLATSILRGMMPGFYAPWESPDGVFAVKDRSVVTGGKTYMAFKGSSGSRATGELLARHHRTMVRRKR